MWVCAQVCNCSRRPEASDPPELEAQKLVSHLKWVPGSSRGTDYTTNCWTLSASDTNMHTHTWAHTHKHGHTQAISPLPVYKTMLDWGYSSECAVSI